MMRELKECKTDSKTGITIEINVSDYDMNEHRDIHR